MKGVDPVQKFRPWRKAVQKASTGSTSTVDKNSLGECGVLTKVSKLLSAGGTIRVSELLSGGGTVRVSVVTRVVAMVFIWSV